MEWRSYGLGEAEGCWQRPGARKATRAVSPAQPSEGANPTSTLILDLGPPHQRDGKLPSSRAAQCAGATGSSRLGVRALSAPAAWRIQFGAAH